MIFLPNIPNIGIIIEKTTIWTLIVLFFHSNTQISIYLVD